LLIATPPYPSMRYGIPLALALITGPAWACFCQPEEPGQFLHLAPATASHPASITVPANARGILFLFDQSPDYLAFDSNGDALISKPKPLSAQKFRIRERGTGRSLTPIAVRLRIEKQMGNARTGYFLGAPEMPQCGVGSDKPAPPCHTLQSLGSGWRKSQPDAPDAPAYEVKPYAQQQGMRDISEEVDAAYGLYRIEAREGYQPGKIYEIQYRDGKRLLKAELRVTTKPLLISRQDQFAVETDGPPQRSWLSMARSGTCQVQLPLASQLLRLVLPPASAYNAHQSLLLYFMQDQRPQEMTQQSHIAERFKTFQYQPTLCTSIAYGGSFHGKGRELATADCRSPSPRQVKAFAGVLEVEDTLHETAPLLVTFPADQAGQCPKRLDEAYSIYFMPPKTS